ncbi:MAG: hypothetical protein OEW00_01595 [candidate division Zixibacteria bacterium]|nr:hypothetical protein [candidate division Zixibacteria bacterium]
MFERKPTRSLLAACLLAIAALAPAGYAQTEYVEEIVVAFDVPKLIHQDIFVQYDGLSIYVPLVEVFHLLDISIEPDFDRSRFTGFLMSTDNKYEIDLSRSTALVNGREYHFPKEHYFLGPAEVFLKIELYETLFGLKMDFDFSSLSIRLPLNEDFPSYQKLLRQKARQKLRKEKVALQDVVELARSRDYLKGGVADWTLAASPLGGAGHYFSLNVGGMVAGGDLTASGTGNTKTGFQADQIRYKWHYYFDDNKYITQAELGDVGTGGLLARGLKGVKATNEPQVRRQFFQTVDVSGYLGDGWEVELYVNNKLTDFTVTDEMGEYHFLTDVYYGSSRIMIKMYGPSGEIRTEEKYYSVPHNLVPRGTVEYTAALGTATVNREERKLGHGDIRYGVLDNLSLGLSGELPVAPETEQKRSVGAEAVYHPMSNLLLSGGYSPGNLFTGSFNFIEPSLVSINGSYTGYFEDSVRNPLQQKRRVRLSVSSPLKIGNYRLGLRYFVTAVKYPAFETIDMNYGFSTQLYRFHINYMGNYKIARRTSGTDKALQSRLFITPRLVRWLRPQFRVNYDHSLQEVTHAGVYVAKRVFKTGQLTFSYERNVSAKTGSFMLTFNIFTDFAQFATRLIDNNGETAISQTQRGSVRFDQGAGSFHFVRKNGVGLGSAVIWPFLDYNYNGVRDAGEPLLPELKAKLSGSHAMRKGPGDLYYYDGLRPYDEYLVQIDAISLDDPQLRPAHENYQVVINPNTVTGINVPVVTGAEVQGVVQRQIPGALVGLGGIRIKITNEQTGKDIEVISFNNGEYFYLGLVPGMYRAEIEPEILQRYGYTVDPTFRTFQVSSVQGGDIVENIDFVLIPEN